MPLSGRGDDGDGDSVKEILTGIAIEVFCFGCWAARILFFALVIRWAWWAVSDVWPSYMRCFAVSMFFIMLAREVRTDRV